MKGCRPLTNFDSSQEYSRLLTLPEARSQLRSFTTVGAVWKPSPEKMGREKGRENEAYMHVKGAGDMCQLKYSQTKRTCFRGYVPVQDFNNGCGTF